MRFAWCLALVACGSSADKPAGGSAETPVAPSGALDKLQVTIDGKPVAMEKAYIKQLPAARYQVYVTNKAASCKQLRDNLFNRVDGEEVLLANIGHRLSPQGKETTIVTDVFIRGSGDVTGESKASVGGSSDEGGRALVSLDYTATGDGRTYAVHGRFQAEGCGLDDDDLSGKTKAAHPSTAQITVGGKTLGLVAASRSGTARDLVLSTSGKSCAATKPTALIILEHADGQWRLEGEWIGKTLSLPETKDLVVTAGAKGKSADGPTIELALSGKATIGDYPVVISGSIEALDCVDKPAE
jgi:hypothetical protein